MKSPWEKHFDPLNLDRMNANPKDCDSGGEVI